ADAVRACGAVQREAEAIADRGRERRVRESDPVRFGLGRERDWLWRGAVAARDRGEIGSKLREAQLWRPHVLEVERSRDAGVVERPLHGTIERELANLDFTCPGGSRGCWQRAGAKAQVEIAGGIHAARKIKPCDRRGNREACKVDRYRVREGHVPLQLRLAREGRR